MIPEQSLHEEANRECVCVIAQVLYPGQLKHFLAVDFLRIEFRLLQYSHQYVERLAHSATQTFDDISEKIGIVDDLNAGARILQTSRDIRRTELIRSAKGGSQHQFRYSRIFRSFIESPTGVKNSERHQWQSMIFDDVNIRSTENGPLFNGLDRFHRYGTAHFRNPYAHRQFGFFVLRRRICDFSKNAFAIVVDRRRSVSTGSGKVLKST